MRVISPDLQKNGVAAAVLAAARREDFARQAKARASVRHCVNRKLPIGQKFGASGKFVKDGEVWGADISMSAVGFLTERPLQLKSRFWMSFEELAGQGVFIEVRVIRCSQLVGNIYQCAAEFLVPERAELAGRDQNSLFSV